MKKGKEVGRRNVHTFTDPHINLPPGGGGGYMVPGGRGIYESLIWLLNWNLSEEEGGTFIWNIQRLFLFFLLGKQATAKPLLQSLKP